MVFFSGKLLEELVVELAKEESLDTETVQNLVYHLKFPGDAVPSFIAQVIADRPSIGRMPSFFPSRLAYGILDDSLLIFDDTNRYHHQARLCRQVERIRLALAKIEHPVRIIEIFEKRLSVLVFATAATNDLGLAERPLSTTELGTLSERVLEAFLVQAELTARLLQRIVRYFKREQKNRLKSRIAQAIKEGIDNQPWDDAHATPLVDLNEPVRFRRSLVQHEDFQEAAWTTLEQVTLLCHN